MNERTNGSVVLDITNAFYFSQDLSPPLLRSKQRKNVRPVEKSPFQKSLENAMKILLIFQRESKEFA